MKARSGHIIFSKNIKYKDLVPIYEDLFMKFLENTKQVSEDPEYTNMLVQTNMMDLKNNRKPEGFNRLGNMRLIFPITDRAVQFYIYRSSKPNEVVKVTESLSKFLNAKGFKHEIQWDKMLLNANKKK